MIPFIAPAGAALLKLAGGTAAIGGAGLGAYGLSQIPNSIKEGILSQGPNDPSDPTKFKTNPLQNLLIDEENLSNEYFKRQQTRLFNNDREVRKRAILLGQKAEDIGTRSAGAYLADTKEEAERLETNKLLKDQLLGMKDGTSYYAALGEKPTGGQLRQAILTASEDDPLSVRGSALESRERLTEDRKIAAENRAEEKRRYNTDRLDLLERQLRQDRNRSEDRKSEFQLNQMQYDLQNRRLDMQEARNFRNDRQKAIMQIVQGMRSMGNAFTY